jgi:hypothetical protein
VLAGEVTISGVVATADMTDLLVVDKCSVKPALRNLINQGPGLGACGDCYFSLCCCSSAGCGAAGDAGDAGDAG